MKVRIKKYVFYKNSIQMAFQHFNSTIALYADSLGSVNDIAIKEADGREIPVIVVVFLKNVS